MLTKIALWTIFLLVTLFSLFFAAPGFSDQDKGRKMIELDGDEKYGPVLLDHHAHQERIADCQTCHSTFAQKQGAIAAAMQSGDLTPKRVMNGICNNCHKIKKADGKKTGPTGCKQCHKK